jgi:hypothetical protein
MQDQSGSTHSHRKPSSEAGKTLLRRPSLHGQRCSATRATFCGPGMRTCDAMSRKCEAEPPPRRESLACAAFYVHARRPLRTVSGANRSTRSAPEAT